MNCISVIEKMQLFLDNELPQTEADSVRNHLSTCADCSSAYKAEKDFRHSVKVKFVKGRLEEKIVDSLKESILNKN